MLITTTKIESFISPAIRNAKYYNQTTKISYTTSNNDK